MRYTYTNEHGLAVQVGPHICKELVGSTAFKVDFHGFVCAVLVFRRSISLHELFQLGADSVHTYVGLDVFV